MKNVLITGAGGGLGLELVKEHLKSQEYHVFALPHSITEELTALVAEYSDSIDVFECDIGSTDSVDHALEQVKGKIKKLDRIFNNAGIHRFADWVELDKTEIDLLPNMYNINAVGALRVIKSALPLIDKGTVIINISSEAASIAEQTAVIGYAYSMSKAAMNMGAKIMDNWLHERGVRIIMIHPGRMRTSMKGSHSNIDPWETSGCLFKLLDRLDEIPQDQLFMDYMGNPLKW